MNKKSVPTSFSGSHKSPVTITVSDFQKEVLRRIAAKQAPELGGGFARAQWAGQAFAEGLALIARRMEIELPLLLEEPKED